jgi:hypothetical protein
MTTARRRPTSKASKSGVASKPDQQAPVVKRPKAPAKAGRPAINSALNTSGTWQVNALMFVLLMIGTLLLYAGDLRLGFFKIDDQQYVVNNPWIRGVTIENLRHILTTPYFVNYSPLHLLSYLFDYTFAGLNAFAFHLSSNIWAGLVAGFVFLVALALTGRQTVAIAAGALFVLHPAHVEAIAWISSRKDLVAAAFALPSLLAYLLYRQGGATAKRWYVVSLLLFVLAVAGKLSVATFFVVFLAHDLFVEQRPLARALLDKVPFLLAAALIALIVASAQPSTGVHPSPYGFLAALVQNLWLLTGFGTYVIYRTPFGSAHLVLQFISVAILIAIFAAPLLIGRRAPVVTVLIYWILFALIPSQVLSFAYPVADRYLFFPSVAAAVLIAWGVITVGERLGRQGLIGAVIFLLAVGSMWARMTITYVSEWRDPRSVWYAASAKSSDTLVFYNLGWQYLDISAGLGKSARKPRPSEGDLRRLASLIWKSDSRLPALLSEWAQGQRGGPIEAEFQHYLRTLAQQGFDGALSTKGRHILPDLYLRRGLLLLDQDDLQGARSEFQAAVDEAGRSSFTEGRQEILVNSYNNLGIVAWRQTNYSEALHWLRLAEDEQTRSGGNWLPDLTANRKRLEAIIATLSSH